MKKFYFLVIIIFGAVLFLTGWISVGFEGVSIYFDIFSIVLLLVCPMVLLLANFSLSDIRKYFTIGFKKENIEPVDLKNGIVFFTALQRYFILSGLLGVFIGVIAILAWLSTPEIIGSGLALALITVLYSIILSMGIAIPFKTGLQKRLNEISK